MNKITEKMVEEHGISSEEYDFILKIIKETLLLQN